MITLFIPNYRSVSLHYVIHSYFNHICSSPHFNWVPLFTIRHHRRLIISPYDGDYIK